MQNMLNSITKYWRCIDLIKPSVWSVVALPNNKLPLVAYEESVRQRYKLLHSILKLLLFGGALIHVLQFPFFWRETYIFGKYPSLAFINYVIYIMVMYSLGVYLFVRRKDLHLLVLFLVTVSIQCMIQVFITGNTVHFASSIPTIGILCVVLSTPITVAIVSIYSLFVLAIIPILPKEYIAGVPLVLAIFWVCFGIFAHVGRTVRDRLDDLALVIHERELEAAQHARAQDEARHAEELGAERTRAQISRDLHDSLGAGLTTIGLQLQACSNSLGDHPAVAQIKATQQLTDQLLEEARKTVHNLRMPIEQQGLHIRIDELLKVDRAAGVAATFRTQGVPRSLNITVEEVLFRVVQEGVTNMRRHAHATCLTIYLDYRNPTKVCLRLQDNGQGTNCTTFSKGSGLQGMRERLQALGGDVRVQSVPGRGFELTAEVPA